MEKNETRKIFKSHFAKKMAESEDLYLSEKVQLRRVGSEISLVSDYCPQPFVQERSALRSKLSSSYNFGSVGSLPSLLAEDSRQRRDEQWISPQKFTDLLDRKESSGSFAMQHSNSSMSNQMDSPSHISKVQTVLAITPSNSRNVEKLERENMELRRQLQMLGRRQENEGRRCPEEEAERIKYEELMREVIRLQNTVNKMEKSNTLYENSTKQLVTLLEGFTSQLVGSTSGRDDEDNFDSLLSRPINDSFRHIDDSFRPSLSSYNSIPSRLSEASFKSIPSLLSKDLNIRSNLYKDSRPNANKADRSTEFSEMSTVNRDSSTLKSSILNRDSSAQIRVSALPSRLSSSMLTDSDIWRQEKLATRFGKDAGMSNARRRIMMGSRDVGRDTANGSMARRTSSSVDLLEEAVNDKHLEAVIGGEDHAVAEKSTLKVRSKSYASGLSKCGEESQERTIGEPDGAVKTKKDGNKVQRFLKQIRSIVLKDKTTSVQKKYEQQTPESNLDAVESEEVWYRAGQNTKTIIKLGTSQALPRSTSLAHTHGMKNTSKVTPKKLISFHHSTPRLDKLN